MKIKQERVNHLTVKTSRVHNIMSVQSYEEKITISKFQETETERSPLPSVATRGIQMISSKNSNRNKMLFVFNSCISTTF